ncbi:MAG: ribonuclease H-like domain-containing protein [Saprospiraceae bacterium]|nr:ribonuclease H-like domain-containing protein [Candidatus Brachybacter algidus]
MSSSNILFLDIETVSNVSAFGQLTEPMKKFWKRNQPPGSNITKKLLMNIMSFIRKAGIFAEYGKIVCISIGFNNIDNATGTSSFRIKSFYGDDEKVLLNDFLALISKSFNDSTKHHFCGHNIKEFDIPYICRRAVIHQIELPNTFQLSGKKPWEVKHLIDTLEEWKYGDYKHFVSLALLAELLDVPTPKDDIDGSMVGHVYWEEKDIERIRTYCQKDVVTVARIYSKMSLGKFIISEEVVIV